MKITGNTILITGGTSGIGRALAEALHAKQNKVIVAGRRQPLLDEMTRQNAGMVGMQLDVNDNQSIHRFTQEIKQRFPELNVLINNAGVSTREDYTADPIDTTAAMTIVQTNITSVLQLTAALLPVLASQPRATLMATTSGLAFVPLAPFPVYSASKAFLHNWLDALRFQLRNSSVEVLELAPPYVQTELGGPRQAKDPRAMPLSEFIDEVMRLIEENRIEKGEILVERVKALRWAERDGTYNQLLTAMGSM
jgi:uncharacterized oxidoreductase